MDMLQNEQSFDAGTTTLKLTRLPRSMTIEALRLNLHEVTTAESYNYIYLPRSPDVNGKNMGIAFVNFVDELSAQLCFSNLQRLHLQSEGRSFRPCRPSKARLQGMGLNLAWLVAKYGVNTLDETTALHVYIDGRRLLNLRSAFATFVTPRTLQSAHRLVQELDWENDAASGQSFAVAMHGASSSSQPTASQAMSIASEQSGLDDYGHHERRAQNRLIFKDGTTGTTYHG